MGLENKEDKSGFGTKIISLVQLTAPIRKLVKTFVLFFSWGSGEALVPGGGVNKCVGIGFFLLRNKLIVLMQVSSGMNVMVERGSRYLPFNVLDTVPGVVFSQLGK